VAASHRAQRPVSFNKRQLKQEIERERKRKVRERLVELRQQIKQARANRKAALLVIRDQCKAERKALTISCENRRADAREETRKSVEERRKQIGGVYSEESVYRQADGRERVKAKGLAKARVRRAEDDDAVRANLPADLVPVFNTVKKHIKGNARRSRTEAFLEWAQENSDEVMAMQSLAADRDVERLIAEHDQLQREENKRSRRRSAVPF
jgi:hypothetical protein